MTIIFRLSTQTLVHGLSLDQKAVPLIEIPGSAPTRTLTSLLPYPPSHLRAYTARAARATEPRATFQSDCCAYSTQSKFGLLDYRCERSIQSPDNSMVTPSDQPIDDNIMNLMFVSLIFGVA